VGRHLRAPRAWLAPSPARIVGARTEDGRFGPHRFPVGTEPGEWRPVLPAFVNDPNAWVKDVEPFLGKEPERFRSHGPYELGSRKYAREFEEVKLLGSQTSMERSDDQTDAARFWAEGSMIITRSRASSRPTSSWASRTALGCTQCST